MAEKVFVLFTGEQVRILNETQKFSALWHPFTCPRDHDGVELTVWEKALVARKGGWQCPIIGCGYTQDWAYDFQADGSLLADLKCHSS